jgi:hypothetical protein
LGNPFTNLSSDPSAQWPGSSGVEYLYYIGLWVGAVIPGESDPSLRYRVSQDTEWRPPSLDPRDKIYEAYAGQPNGEQWVDDDHDGRIDEDRLDGRDNDGDGLIDEDYAAISQQMFSCVMRDDTPEAIEAATTEKHIPIGLEVHQTTYAFSAPELRDAAYATFEIANVSGKNIDSVYVGFFVDQDVGPVSEGRFFADDLPEPQVPQGPDPTIAGDFSDPNNPNSAYREVVAPNDPKIQTTITTKGPVDLCPEDSTHVNGFTMTDNDGDGGQTPGASSFLLLDHTTDPLGLHAQRRVGFHMYRYYRPGVTYSQGGLPSNDRDRYESLSQSLNVSHITGLIDTSPASTPDDYVSLCSIGPFLNLAPNDTITVTCALAVQDLDYSRDRSNLAARYAAVIRNAVTIQRNYDGSYVQMTGIPAPPPGTHGDESWIRADPGTSFLQQGDCQHPGLFTIDDKGTWMDLDCNVCSGVGGYSLRHWGREGPPPSPDFEATPGDRKVTLRWDNRSEYVPDAATDLLDFKGYEVWRADNWQRPRGSVGPSDTQWRLLGTYYAYDELHPLIERTVTTPGETLTVKTSNVLVNRAWREGSPLPPRLFPHDVPCPGSCDTLYERKVATNVFGGDSLIENYAIVQYPIGRYEVTDDLVQDGFVYFYSLAAFDSSGIGPTRSSFESRNGAREGGAVTPQATFASSRNGGEPFVVPNPYRGHAEWDLHPDAADPSGTHVDFVNLPPSWSVVRIYTLSGDLVQEIRPADLEPGGKPQRQTPDDDQARWDLISRNGQEVVSGIYLFSVQTVDQGSHVGKFVIIR